ncbi:MAG: hypothetical protein H6Q26_2306 [Bacteroidetes bacterium]|uniref:DUF4397 domain-containing protein n=1 Tax=unclassified Chitinophaga TaxID=2619133 RepID=UPI0015C31C09|nr:MULTISPECIES: DUF4397 domain-containing protein [unclassified Chitinophaga]MBP1652149.1 hypothetical protein [Bacteroidota bacterium]WPV69587.1 DUF4397 domain-containing protein [Chitinophaga sp. LS1]
MKKFIVLLVIIAGIYACNKDSDSSIPDTTSYLNVFVANPDASYDIVLDTTSMGTGLSLGEYTGYKSFTAKRYTLCIFATGDREDTLIQGQISLRNNHYYTIYFEKNHNNILQFLATEDKMGATSSKTVGYLRVVNLSDSYDTTGTTATVMDFGIDGTEFFSNIGYLGYSVFKEITPGAHSRDIRDADSTSLNTADFNIEAGKSYSWIVYGNALVADSFKVVTFQHN